jgi:restriction endonuclease Mrr
MSFSISECLDNDPIYKELVDRRHEIGRMLHEYDVQNPAPAPYSNEVLSAKYKRYSDEYVELSSRISEYERGTAKQDVDSGSQGLVDTDTIGLVVTDINEELKRYFAKHPEALYDLAPRKFEMLIADILKDLGFETTLTQATHDRGVDIYAYLKNQIGAFLTFVECKRWQPGKHVGIEVVQRLYGVQQSNRANKSLIVTTSFFTKPAIEECRRYEHLMDLKDYYDLKEWLNSYR